MNGKFGMKSESAVVDVFDQNTEDGAIKFRDYENTYSESIQFVLELEDDVWITVRRNLHTNSSEDMYHGIDVNVAIASQIAGGGRVFMSYVKNNPAYNLYYSDTDSLVIDRPNVIGTDLGLFKLEHVIKRAVFLAPE